MKIQFLIIGVMMVSANVFTQDVNTVMFQKLDSLLSDAYDKGIFTGQVILSHRTKQIYYRKYGYADWNTKREMDPKKLFNIGSLNKQFTEEIIHQLVQEGHLQYQDKLSKYIDVIAADNEDKITVEMLLDMKAGLGDYLRNPKFRKIQQTDFSLNELIEIIKVEPLLFEPGTQQEYSNSGYAVLGALIEKVTGKSYEENLLTRIAKPLGISEIYYARDQKSRQVNRAFGHLIDFDGKKRSVDESSNSTPAGGIYMNIGGMLKFAEAKMNGQLASGRKYGNGMFAGGTDIWNATIYYHEKSGFSFAVMANTGEIADELSPRIKAILNGESYPPLELPFQMVLYKIIKEKGMDYVKQHVEDLAMQAKLPYDDRFLNYFGYQFLRGNKMEIALDLFKMNVSLFPKVVNTYDSLAEAYLKSGDKMNALKYYKLALELSPNDDQLKEKILDLEK